MQNGWPGPMRVQVILSATGGGFVGNQERICESEREAEDWVRALLASYGYEQPEDIRLIDPARRGSVLWLPLRASRERGLYECEVYVQEAGTP